MTTHPWALVGPWYRSESVGGPPANRTTAPIFQKYGDAGFMEKFIREPQYSLHFSSEDFIDRVSVDPNAIITPEVKRKLDDSLKLFLHAHNRFYLIVCELYCVVPGFPSAKRGEVCESGFVIRRKVPKIKADLQLELSNKQRKIRQLKQQILRLQNIDKQTLQQPSILRNAKNKAKKKLADFSILSFNKKTMEKLNVELEKNQQDLNSFILKHNIKAVRQGWIPSENDGAIGNWQEVEAHPQTMTEKVYPLYPLDVSPSDDQHSAKGKTLWFGLVPTSSVDVDSQGNPQLDESDLYHIQCFVRRKKHCCTGGKNCCHGELVWSQPTENYRLAAFFDIDGTSHKPINIKLPDLNALKEQANLGPPGRGANVKAIAPADSSLNFGANGMDMPTGNSDMPTRPGQQICFFAIFLFFMVALFLFRLFLPIILFLFQLWFLLKLKLCIPPSIDLDVGLAADLEVHGPEFEVSLSADIIADFGIAGVTDQSTLKTKLAESMAVELSSPGYSDGAGIPAPNMFASHLQSELEALSLNELADVYISMSRDFSDDPNPEAPVGQLSLPEDGLKYFTPVNMI
ncbi:hypothetical protein AB835_00670 [Candidatus Endobugula sertula]|uniref:Uncharacterized protein n=1 Tax=Candidatus Endobugula sertula TaxID=62101 RepID=A0A1D2QTY7_9GAMM|nr:hypothetical protein AB835_00670 [Candidatus Endobugula sertula]